jgi:hypothetical protein
VKDIVAAHTQVASELVAYRSSSRGPVMAVVEASGGFEALKAHVAPLREMPCCNVPPHEAASTFDSQTWQHDVVHDVMLWTLQWHAFLQERATVARCESPSDHAWESIVMGFDWSGPLTCLSS